jgi:hypothetical protein
MYRNAQTLIDEGSSVKSYMKLRASSLRSHPVAAASGATRMSCAAVEKYNNFTSGEAAC